MIKQIGNYEFRIYISKLEKRAGICSQKFDKTDNHILLWDFDNENLDDIIYSLDFCQREYNLPEIVITESSPKNYHAYCFASRTFRETIHILASIPEIDLNYLKLGIARGYYTLRISKRKGELFKAVKILDSIMPDEMLKNEMTINEYLTSNKGGHNAEEKT